MEESPIKSVAGTHSPEAVLRDACDSLDRRLRAGEVARCEEFFARSPELADDPDRALDLIYMEFSTRRETGERLDHDEYFRRFPQFRDQLDQQFRLDELLNDGDVPNDGDAAGRADGRFRVLRLHARGGIGQVMRAIDTELNREVAIKELQPDRADHAATQDRFLREAEITGRLEHPGVVPVYALGRDPSGRPFYAMRLVHGQSLQEAIDSHHEQCRMNPMGFRAELQKLLRRFLAVCDTIAYAHSRGVIHRDIKPSNILLGPFGETLVVDWGLARTSLPDPMSQGRPTTSRPTDDNSSATVAPAGCDGQISFDREITQAAGDVIGTPAFMSPEQARGEAPTIGPASDVYGLGATLFCLIAGRSPFEGTVADVLQKVVAGEFLRPRDLNSQVPKPLEAICLKAMAQRPEDRYASPRELAADIERWLADEPISALPDSSPARLARWTRRHRLVAGAAALALVAITVVAVVAALRIDAARLLAVEERGKADRSADEAARQAEDARRQASLLALGRGTKHIEQHEYGPAMHWLARSLERAPRSERALREVILTNMAAVPEHLIGRVAELPHPASIAELKYSPDGSHLATIDVGSTLRLWNAQDYSLEKSWSLPFRGSRVVITPAGRIVVSGFAQGKVHLWDPEWAAGTPPIELGPIAAGRAPIFSHNGDVVCAADGSVTRLYRVSDGELLGPSVEHPSPVGEVAFDPTGQWFATSSGTQGVRVWDRSTMEPVGEPVIAAVARVLAFDPTGARLATCGPGGVQIWDLKTRRPIGSWLPHNGTVVGCAWSTDGNMLATTADDGTIHFWNAARQAPIAEVLQFARFGGPVEFRPNSREVVLTPTPATVTVFSLPQPGGAIPLDGEVLGVAVSPDGRRAAAGSRSGLARLWDVERNEPIGEPLRHTGAVRFVSFSPDGRTLLSATLGGDAALWNAETGELRAGPIVMPHMPSGPNRFESGMFSPDGRVFATGSADGRVRLWDSETASIVSDTMRLPGFIHWLSFSPDGRRLAAVTRNARINFRVWDVASGEQIWEQAHSIGSRMVKYSPDGRLLISASLDGSANFWDADTGEQIGDAMRHQGELFAAAFSSDGRLAATAGYDGTARLWHVPSGRPAGHPMRHQSIVLSVAFSRDNRRVLTGSLDRTARLWDVATCLPIAPPWQHERGIVSVTFDPAGRFAFTGRFWNIPKPRPDDPVPIRHWIRAVTERELSDDDSMRWLSADELRQLPERVKLSSKHE